MSKPTELNDTTKKRAGYWARHEMHCASSSLNMPAYPLNYTADQMNEVERDGIVYMADSLHYAHHAADHIFQALQFINLAEANRQTAYDRLSVALLKYDIKQDPTILRDAIVKALSYLNSEEAV